MNKNIDAKKYEKEKLKKRILEMFEDLQNHFELNTTIEFDTSNTLKCYLDRYNSINEELAEYSQNSEDDGNSYQKYSWWQMERIIEYALEKVKNKYGLTDMDVREFYQNDNIVNRVELSYLLNKEIDKAVEDLCKLRKCSLQNNRNSQTKDADDVDDEEMSVEELDDDIQSQKTPNQNEKFCKIKELVIAALRKYADYHSNEKVTEFADVLEDELENFGNGYECETEFSFWFNNESRYGLESWNFLLSDEGVKIVSCGYEKGECGGDSYTNGIYRFYGDGTNEETIFYEEDLDCIISCEEETELEINAPDEFIHFDIK